MQIQEYLLPNPAACPRRIAITPDDQVWYTDFARATSVTSIRQAARLRSLLLRAARNRGLTALPTKGALWYVEFGAKPNAVVRFDPQTGKFQSWAIPGGGDIVRNMTVDRSGNLVMAHSLVNMVGRVEINDATH